jgi:hypothetical protein
VPGVEVDHVELRHRANGEVAFIAEARLVASAREKRGHAVFVQAGTH